MKNEKQDIRLLIALILIVGLAVLIGHWPALSAKALSFDDTQYLTENALVKNPSWHSVRRFLTEVLEPSTVGGYYQPLSMISLMIDYALGGRADNPYVFHCTSLGLHVANTVIIIVLLYILFGQPWIAAGVGLLFGLHPMTVETIAWIGERKTLLASFFALASLLIYVLYSRRKNPKLYVGCIVTYILSLMSKPTALPLPALMLLMDFWPLKSFTRRRILDKIPLFAIGAIFAVIIYISQSRTAIAELAGGYGLERIPLVICHNIIFYLYKIIWPVNLSSHYVFPRNLDFSDTMVLVGVFGTVLLIALLIFSLRYSRAAFTGWLFFFIAIFPSMQLVRFSNVIASDKFAYLPSVGLLMVLSAFLVRLCDFGKGQQVAKPVILMAIVISAAGLSVATRRYLVHWRDSISLYNHMLTLSPDSASLHSIMGFTLREKGELDKALVHFRKAIEINPDYFTAYGNIALIFKSQGKIDEAIKYSQKMQDIKPDYAKGGDQLGFLLNEKGLTEQAIQQYYLTLQYNPDYVPTIVHLADLLLSKGKVDEAIDYYYRALKVKRPNLPDNFFVPVRLKLADILMSQEKYDQALKQYNLLLAYYPDSANINNSIGVILRNQGKIDDAIERYKLALKTEPNYTEAHYNLGVALGLKGRVEESIDCYKQALKIEPTYARAHNNLGYLLASKGQLPQAIFHYARAIDSEPNFAQAHNNLANALRAYSRPDEAILQYRHALLIKPNYADARYNLANTLQSKGKIEEAIEQYREFLKIRPRDAQANYNLGTCLELQGNISQALEAYKKAVEIKPDYEQAQNALKKLEQKSKH